MEYIIITLFGIFIGIAIAAYMFVDEINKKEKYIRRYKETSKDLRNENEEKSLFINKVVDIMNRKDINFVDKYDKIKELVDKLQSVN